MENKRTCSRCKYFLCFYTKETRTFQKAECGICNKNIEHKTVNLHDSCEHYETKRSKRKIDRSVLVYLNDLLTEITMLRCFIGEQIDENEKDENV